jgi:glycosyltransferase involved in cell wall biosynthesis
MAEPETAAETAPRLAAAVPAVSVVVPVFNEERTLEEVYRRVTETLEALGRPYEVIVVDDGSRDGTWAIV